MRKFPLCEKVFFSWDSITNFLFMKFFFFILNYLNSNDKFVCFLFKGLNLNFSPIVCSRALSLLLFLWNWIRKLHCYLMIDLIVKHGQYTDKNITNFGQLSFGRIHFGHFANRQYRCHKKWENQKDRSTMRAKQLRKNNYLKSVFLFLLLFKEKSCILI